MKKPIFTGVCTALVTPFLGETINTPMLRQLIRRQEQAGIDGLVICGTTGESATLSDGEKTELFRVSREAIPENMAFLAGTGSNDTAHAVALSQTAEGCGADGLLVVSPYYNKATQQGLLRHYKVIADSVGIPIILYNVPSRTGVNIQPVLYNVPGRTGLDIPVSVYKALSALPNVIGVKEASPDIRKIAGIRRECPRDFFVWCGNDDLAVPAMALGALGVISVVSNVEPERTRAMVWAALDGDFDTASDIQLGLLPLIEALFREVNPAPVKAAMALLGYDCGQCRLPVGSIRPETLTRLRELL